MADAKITSLAALAADPANNDMFVIVDVSDTSMASTGTDKKLAASYLMKASQGTTFLLADGSRASTGAQTFSAGIVTGTVRPASDSATAFRVQNAAGSTDVLTVNTTTGNVKISGEGSLRGIIFDHHSLLNRDSSWLYLRNAADSDYSNFICGRFASIYYGSIGGSYTSVTPPAGGLIVQGFTGIGTPTPVTRLHITEAASDYTSSIENIATFAVNANGTPAAGFGVGFAALLESSTTVDQNAGRLTFAWSTATHASRAAVGKLTAYYTSTEREAITWTADSASVTVSIAGNTRATGSVQVTGSAFASHTGAKSFNAQGAGYDGTRFWAGYLGLGAYWDATNWKTGTDGGSNGASLILGQGYGDDLSFYTMSFTGTSQQTIAHGSLASSLRLTLNASYAEFTGAVRSGYDTNLTSYFGRAAIGYNGSTSDVASFGHIDMNTSANIALFQTAAGESWFNCASGQNLIFARGGFSLGQWDTSGNLHPAVDNTVDCGKSGSRWNDIWASNATIQTSDQRDKRALQPSALGLDFVKALQPVSWVWADKGKRPHFGFIAQQVKQAMDAVGVDDFAGYIYDGETDSYSLRYSEFLSPIVKALQELLQRVERLEKAN